MTVMEAITNFRAPYTENSLVVVKIPEKKERLDKKSHTEYLVETTKGPFSIILRQSPFFKDLIKNYYLFEGIKVGWLSKDVVTFGPIDMSLIQVPISHDSILYNTWDIFLSFGGFAPTNTHLCFSKKDHTGLYGAPKEALNGVVGRVIQGAHIIPMLRRTDLILSITPITYKRKQVLQLRPYELREEPITPDMEIFTYISVALYKEAKLSVDHFLSVIDSGLLNVNQASSMFIKNIKYRGIRVPSENSIFRQDGTITIRNQGNDAGSVYIYKKNTSFSASHNVIGRIDSKHLPLVENANLNDKILVKTHPVSLIFTGKTQKYANDHLTQCNISHKRVGNDKDEAIIVEQRPKTTMDVWEEETCVTLGLNPSQIIQIQFFYEKSPLSITHFQKNTDMLFFPIGKLQVLENLKTLILFIPLSGVESIEAIPREQTLDKIPAGAIGVTNALRRLTGSIGIRLNESDTYGPTGETLEGTNIIGRVVSGLEILEKLDTGDIVWFIEVQHTD